MNYAQFDEEGSLITQVNDKESLPTTWRWPDGSATSGFNTLDDEALYEAGWLPVIGVDEPAFDPETQMLSNEHVVLVAGVATRTWDVVDIPPEPAPRPTDHPLRKDGQMAARMCLNATDPWSVEEAAALSGYSPQDLIDEVLIWQFVSDSE